MTSAAPGLLGISYRDESARDLLAQSRTLAVFSFDGPLPDDADPRHVGILQEALDSPAPRECWTVDGDVTHAAEDDLRWAHGGGWHFVAIEVDEAAAGGIEAACAHAYDRLLAHVAARRDLHLLRIWNYLGAINCGDGDDERYRRFCSARAHCMAAHGMSRYPAATAIGHGGAPGRLQVYALCAAAAGAAIENPRQVSAWAYPREYGPAAPSFARAMCLPGGGLAISGTAAVIGHASHHPGDVVAQVTEAVANLRALLDRAGLPEFDGSSPLKVYVRNRGDADAVRDTLARQLAPSVPRLLLQGDICRRELLVEIDGWRFGNTR